MRESLWKTVGIERVAALPEKEALERLDCDTVREEYIPPGRADSGRGLQCARMSSSPPDTGDYLSDVFFSDLPLPHAVRAGIAACGFVRATPVQAKTLPLLLAGKDVAAQAQTGTGKTAAYLVSILTRLVEVPSPREPEAGGAARAHRRPDAGARRPDRARRAPPLAVRQAPHRDRLRRPRLRQAAEPPPRRLRHPDRHARPPPRLRGAGGDVVRLGRVSRHRRVRPALRPRLHPRPAAHPPPLPAPAAPPLDDVLGDALLARHGARLGAHERRRADRDRSRRR